MTEPSNLIYSRDEAYKLRREVIKKTKKKWHVKKVAGGWTLIPYSHFISKEQEEKI